jgi:LacI family transcriptional regulator
MRRKSRISIVDVAKAAGVSVQTVSRVINNKDGVSDEMRERVWEFVNSLGYQPNDVARSLVAGRTFTLACISQSLTDFALASIIEAMRKQAQKQGYIVLTGAAPDANEARNLIDIFQRRQMDGLVIIDPGMDERLETVRELVNRGFPVVYISTTPKGEPVSYVNCDDYDCGYQATAYLIGLGHRKIATVTGPLNEEIAATRLRGYRQALNDVGIGYDEGLVVSGAWLSQSGYDCVQRLTQRTTDFTAIVCQSDPMAIGAMSALRDVHLSVPDRVSLIGVDDHPWISFSNPPMTTMHQDLTAIGDKAIDFLLDRINNKQWKPQGALVKTTLVERSSCRQILNG